MQNVIIFHQESEGPDLKSPWPVVFAATGDAHAVELVSGRPDADHIIGFSEPGHYEISVLAGHVFEDPSQIVGLTPVFSDGNFFSDTRKVAEARFWDGTEEGLVRLREREAEYRAAFKRIDRSRG